MQPEPDVDPLRKVCTDAFGVADPWITRVDAFVIPSDEESPVSVAGVSERLVGAAVPCGTVVVVVGGTVVVVVVDAGDSTATGATGATGAFGGTYEQPDSCTG